MSDYAAFLSHNPSRRMPWTGHADFPRKSVKWALAEAERYTSCPYRLRIFELDWVGGQPNYFLLTEEDVASYME